MEGTDAVQFGNAPCPDNQINQIVVPPAPAVASAAYGTELIEMYWASLLRDVPFTDYASNPTATQAAAELTAQPTYAGPRDGMGHVTPDLLFRGPIRVTLLGLTSRSCISFPLTLERSQLASSSSPTWRTSTT